jgi:hypothetical protein
MSTRHFELLADWSLVLQPPSVGQIPSAVGPFLAVDDMLDLETGTVE